VQQKFSTLLGPPTLHLAPLLGWGTPVISTIVMPEWHTVLLYSAIFHILGGFSDTHIIDGLGSFSGVLKVNAKI
jgi:hypothetical protein